MAYLLISDFQSGLDTRKSPYTAPPGSLRVGRNVHLTRGGEIEVRKKFVGVYTLPAGQTKGATTVRGQIIVFGSAASVAVPAGVNYQQLAAPSGAALAKILSTDNFDGKVYAVAEFVDGSIYHFFNGVRVTDWDTIAGQVGSNDGVATVLAGKVDGLTAYTALATGTRFTVTGAPGVDYVYAGSVAPAGQTLTAVVDQNAVAGVTAASATGSVKIISGQAGANITSLKVGNVELLRTPVPFVADLETTAQALAAYISSTATSPNYFADPSDTEPGLVTLTAELPGTTPNGLQITIAGTGGVNFAPTVAMHGGVNTVVPVPKIVTFTIGGAFNGGSQFTVSLGSDTVRTMGQASGMGTFVRTLGQKMYATTQSLLYFSGFSGSNPAVADPTKWINVEGSVTGAGFINMATQDGGSSQLTGLAVYQNKLAVFSRRNTQIWSMDPDPANNQQLQVLFNVGTASPRTLAAFGDVDVFFLSESGVRSLRARDSSNTASADDVGSAVDGEVLTFLKTLDESLVHDAVALSEPFEGRYLLAVGSRVYVFSHFPGSKVSAWTDYVLEEAGTTDATRVVTDFCATHTNVVARVGDRLYLYGGRTAMEYALNEEFTYRVSLPFHDANVPSQSKQLTGLDIGCEGFWDVYLATEPKTPDVRELVAKVKDSTYGSWGRAALVGVSTHFSLTLEHTANGYARLANLMVHFAPGENG
ncbi:hypothetical protein IB275_30515 [Pseudomonas sp. PDM21]|uniref:hypothetical protein n=1 Tax=Pseudomonas sp. PDM21 TaxID=2769257 RepID=UPI00177C2D74|nr:hypothetical protein [Pseudomonas sp. PDM21]MBD9674950.1 hypothetical protein [Pseudomonas sp. PDM21]